MTSFVLGSEEVDRTQGAVVGGKAAQLAELSRLDGVRVPAWFCVTGAAFSKTMAKVPSLAARLEQLSRLKADDREAIRALSAEIRRSIEAVHLPDEVVAAVTCALAGLGEQAAYAVRSSATAEICRRLRSRASRIRT